MPSKGKPSLIFTKPFVLHVTFMFGFWDADVHNCQCLFLFGLGVGQVEMQRAIVFSFPFMLL